MFCLGTNDTAIDNGNEFEKFDVKTFTAKSFDYRHKKIQPKVMAKVLNGSFQ